MATLEHLGTHLIIVADPYDFRSAVYKILNDKPHTFIDKFEFWHSPNDNSYDYDKYLKFNMSSDIRRDLRKGKLKSIVFVRCEKHFTIEEFLAVVPNCYVKQLNKIDKNWREKIASGEIPSIMLNDAYWRATEIFEELGT